MEKMRFAGAIAGLAAIGMVAGACSSGEPTASEVAPEEVTGTIRVLAPTFPASNEGQAAFDDVVAAFQEEYPGVEVEPDFATFGNLNEKISTALAGGQFYDVVVTGMGWVPPLASQGAFLNLDQFGVTAETIAEEANPAAVSPALYDGEVYAYPLLIGAGGLALSRSAFEEAGLDPDSPPSSLEEIADMAEQLTIRDDDGTIIRPGFDFWAAANGYRHRFVSVLGALGRDLYEDGEPGYMDGEGVEALEWMSDMINEREVIGYGQKSASGAPMLLSGDAAMGFLGGYIDCDDVGQEICDDLEFFLLEDQRPAMFAGGQLASVGAQTDLPEASWAFIEAMSTPEAQTVLASMNFGVPALAGMADSEAVLSNPSSEFSYANLEYSVYEGGATNWLDLRDTFNNELDKVLLGQATAEEVLTYLAEQSE